MLIVLLPAYNEEESLPLLLPKLGGVLDSIGIPFRIIVCNDGSHDGTARTLEEFRSRLPLEVLHHRINRGLGETVRDLFEHAAVVAGPDDIIVRLDCDDTHEPKHILAMLQKLDEGYDIVIASRFQEGGGQSGVTPYRAFISYGANIFMKLVFGVRGVRDFSSGFRAYRASIVKEAVSFYGNNLVQLKGLGFTCTLEKLIKFKILGARFAEVPFHLRYDQKVSASKMVSSITTLGYLVMAVMYHWPWGGWRRSYRARRTP
jgi:dolichol-phosphate mannosyltransferase